MSGKKSKDSAISLLESFMEREKQHKLTLEFIMNENQTAYDNYMMAEAKINACEDMIETLEKMVKGIEEHTDETTGAETE